MKTLYLDLFSGISGDMFVGALIDLGVDAHKLERELKKLNLGDWRMHIARNQRSGIGGTKFDVQVEESRKSKVQGRRRGPLHDPHQNLTHNNARNFAEIKQLMLRSRLSKWVKKKSIAVFQRIAEAEGKIHGLPPAKVHFHEVGAVDSILDIVGACIALDTLGKPRVLASPVIEGTGWIDCEHGRFPVPAPATLAILGARGIGVTQCDEPHELVTPTGAALLAEFAESFAPMQNLVAEKTGFGLGTRENKTRPNVLRAMLGKYGMRQGTDDKVPDSASRRPSRVTHYPLDWETDSIAVLETNLDNMNPEILGHFVETALTAGALDVFCTPIQMKKNRPGVLLTILCTAADADKFSEMVLRGTSAFGVRRTMAERRKLRREFVEVGTPLGKITMKLGRLNDTVIQATPEHECCKSLAARAKIPIKRVYEAACRAMVASA